AGLAVLVLRPGAPEDTATSTTVAGEASVVLGGISETIHGFPDGLVAVARGDGQSLELLIWPIRGEPIERIIPVGVSRPPGPVEFDVSGRRISTLLPVPDQAHGVLYAGVPQDAAIIATDVTGYAWHDTGASQLAYTTFVDDELQLWVVHQGNGEPELVTRAVGIDGHVEAWGDWGFAVQDDARDSIVLLTDAGEIKDTNVGRILDSDGTGWLAIDNQGVSLLSSGGGVRGLEMEGLEGQVLAGRYSEDGQQLALLTTEGLHVRPVEGAGISVQSDGRPGVPQLAWGSDGHFIAYPGSRGISVVDTRNAETVEILTDRTFTGLEMLSLGDS
ncbi:MAG: hypothetical protein ACRDXF_10665, partial [Acidimicrobiia bacterium]